MDLSEPFSSFSFFSPDAKSSPPQLGAMQYGFKTKKESAKNANSLCGIK